MLYHCAAGAYKLARQGMISHCTRNALKTIQCRPSLTPGYRYVDRPCSWRRRYLAPPPASNTHSSHSLDSACPHRTGASRHTRAASNIVPRSDRGSRLHACYNAHIHIFKVIHSLKVTCAARNIIPWSHRDTMHIVSRSDRGSRSYTYCNTQYQGHTCATCT